MRILSMAERLQTEASYVGAAHGADWSAVDQTGDLLYIGSSTNVRQRLGVQHIMWTVTNARTELPRIRVAVWMTDDFVNVERAMTDRCAPLWSDCAGSYTPAAWRMPDLLMPLHAVTNILARPGVYAWVLLPDNAGGFTDDIASIMVESTVARRGRKRPAPRVYYCLECHYATLHVPDVCTRCNRVQRELQKEAQRHALAILDNE